MSESLKKKTVKGTAWSAIDNVANQGITFLVGLVLARILTPQEYGLIGIILIFIAIFNSIVDSGFSNALIRKNDASELDYNTVFIINLGVSVLILVLMLICAPLIGQFFGQHELVPLTRVMSIVVIINAFSIIPRTILIKKIDFKTQTKISLIASITSGVVGIAMALCGYGVWALVGQQLSRQLLNTIFLWVWCHWRPKVEFSIVSFRELFGFGWKLLVSSLLTTIWNEIYQIVIGKFYTPVALGQYTRAQQFSTVFSSNLTSIVQRVSYPVLSSIHDNIERLKSAYRKVIQSTMLISFVFMIGLAAVAKPMIYTLIGEKWFETVPMLQIICFSMMLYPLHALNLNIIQVSGRSDLILRLEIIKKIIAIGPILLGVFVGIYCMLFGSVLCGFISYFLNAHYSGVLINYGIKEQIKDLIPSLLIALINGGIMYSLSFIPLHINIVFIIQLLVGLVSLMLLLELFGLSEYREMKGVVLTEIYKLIKR